MFYNDSKTFHSRNKAVGIQCTVSLGVQPETVARCTSNNFHSPWPIHDDVHSTVRLNDIRVLLFLMCQMYFFWNFQKKLQSSNSFNHVWSIILIGKHYVETVSCRIYSYIKISKLLNLCCKAWALSGHLEIILTIRGLKDRSWSLLGDVCNSFELLLVKLQPSENVKSQSPGLVNVTLLWNRVFVERELS